MLINKSNFIVFKTSINTKMNYLKNRKIKLLIYSFYIVLIDQISKFTVLNTLGFERSKAIIPNLLDFNLVKNKGAAFSLFSNSTTLLTIISIITSLLLITLILKSKKISYWNSLGLVYLLGGTLGNGIDRLLKGYVLDFLEIVPINFPIFNVADISINIAIICFTIDLFIEKRSIKKSLRK